MLENSMKILKCSWNFILNPKVSHSTFDYKDMKEYFICYLLVLPLSYLIIQITSYAFTSINIPMYQALNLFYATVVTVWTTVYIGLLFGVILHVITFFRVKNLWQKGTLQFIRFFIVVVPIVTLIFSLGIYLLFAEVFNFEVSGVTHFVGVLSGVAYLYFIYRLILQPFYYYLNTYMHKILSGISIVITVGLTWYIGIITPVPFVNDVFDADRFGNLVVEGLYNNNKIDKAELEKYKEVIRRGLLDEK